MDSLSLGSIVSPKDLCSDIIVRYVRSMRSSDGESAVSVQTVAGGRVEACEFLIGSGALHQNTPLKDIRFKPNVLIAAISHRGATQIASGLSEYQAGDSVIVISTDDHVISRFNDIFA